MDDRIMPAQPEPQPLGPDGRPQDSYWFGKLDELYSRYARRSFNAIVRMKLDSDMRALAAEAERFFDIDRDAFKKIVERWIEHRIANPRTFTPMRGF